MVQCLELGFGLGFELGFGFGFRFWVEVLCLGFVFRFCV